MLQKSCIVFCSSTQPPCRWWMIWVCASIFPPLFGWRMTASIGILEINNCFSIFSPPSPSPCKRAYVRSYINIARTHHPDGEALHQDSVMPGVTHQPSQHSGVKCQQSQIPQPCLCFQHRADEHVCSCEWVFLAFFLSAYLLYTVHSVCC